MCVLRERTAFISNAAKTRLPISILDIRDNQISISIAFR